MATASLLHDEVVALDDEAAAVDHEVAADDEVVALDHGVAADDDEVAAEFWRLNTREVPPFFFSHCPATAAYLLRVFLRQTNNGLSTYITNSNGYTVTVTG